MNINVTLLNEIKYELPDYDCDYKEVEDLLLYEKRFPEKQLKAIEIIKKVVERNEKQSFGHQMDELARIESGIRDIEPWLRDHVVHATLSFFIPSAVLIEVSAVGARLTGSKEFLDKS
jgi:hypothetical protein